MEFVGNKINFKTVLATLTVAFLIGRVEMFGGTFPLAVSLITVMMAVSTLYIYLVPVIFVALISAADGVIPMGDGIATAMVALFFLFFHSTKFTINMRTLISIIILLVAHLGYALTHTETVYLEPEKIICEIVVIIVYIRVFNVLAKVIYAGENEKDIPKERIVLCMQMAAVAICSALEFRSLVFGIWFLLICIISYCKDAKDGICVTAICDVFWRCMSGSCSSVFTSIFAGILVGRFIVPLINQSYRKATFGAIIFVAIVVSTETFFISAVVSTACFVLIPKDVLYRFWAKFEHKISPNEGNKDNIKVINLKKILMRKRQSYRYLSKAFKDINGCQFEGLVRIIDRFLRELDSTDEIEGEDCEALSIGSSSYPSNNISGDSIASFNFDGNKQGLIISDGMGKGEEAAAESQMIVRTLTALLEAGFDVDIALRTVNGLIMSETQKEVFASLDFAIINKDNRHAYVFKMGAASTFVKHEQGVTMLKKPALPMGVIDGVRLEYLDVKLSKGDVFVMVSDGITDCKRSDPSCNWLCERLGKIGSSDPKVIADLIIKEAAINYGIKERDDLTVLVAVV